MPQFYRYFVTYSIEWKPRQEVVQAGIDKCYNKMLQQLSALFKNEIAYKKINFQRSALTGFFSKELVLSSPIVPHITEAEKREVIEWLEAEKDKNQIINDIVYQIVDIKRMGYFPLETANEDFVFRKGKAKALNLFGYAGNQKVFNPFYLKYTIPKDYKTILEWSEDLKKFLAEDQKRQGNPIEIEKLIVLHGFWSDE